MSQRTRLAHPGLTYTARSWPLRALAVAAALASGPACRGAQADVRLDPDRRDVEPGPVQPEPAEPDPCSRDLAALRALADTPVACARDGDCPTGAHCEEATAACAFACLPASAGVVTACGVGQRCDCRGRCRARGTLEDRPIPPTWGTLTFGQRAVALALPQTGNGPAHARVQVMVRRRPEVAAHPPTDVRFEADPGLVIACGGDQTFAATCVRHVEGDTTDFELEIRRDGGSDGGGPWSVTFAGPELLPAEGALAVLAAIDARRERHSAAAFFGRARLMGSDGAILRSIAVVASRHDGTVTLREQGSMALAPHAIALAVDGSLSHGVLRTALGRDDSRHGLPKRELPWRGALKDPATDGDWLVGAVQVALAPDLWADWELVLHRVGAASPQPRLCSPEDRRALRGPLEPAAMPAWQVRDQLPPWRAAVDADGDARRMYADLAHHYDADGRPTRVPGGVERINFAPSLANLGSAKEVSLAIARHGLTGTLDQTKWVVHAVGSREDGPITVVRDYGTIVGEQFPEADPVTVRMLCVPHTFPRDGLSGPLEAVDCAHVLGPSDTGEPAEGRCNTIVGVAALQCPTDGFCRPGTQRPLRLCALGPPRHPVTAAAVAEGALCFDRQLAASDLGVKTTMFSRQADPNTGDLLCGHGGPAAAVPWAGGHLVSEGADAVQRCLRDTTTPPPAHGGIGAWQDAANVDQHLCLSPLRYFTALNMLLDPRAVHPADDLYLQHLLRQWLWVHERMADRASIVASTRLWLGGRSLPEETVRTPDAEAVQLRIGDGLGMLLSPSVWPRIQRLTPSALARPDYRHYAGFRPNVFSWQATSEATVGMPVTMLEAATSLLQLTGNALDTMEPDGATAKVMATLQLAQAIQVQADLLVSRARGPGGELTWEHRYRLAAAAFGAEVKHVERALGDLTRPPPPRVRRVAVAAPLATTAADLVVHAARAVDYARVAAADAVRALSRKDAGPELSPSRERSDVGFRRVLRFALREPLERLCGLDASELAAASSRSPRAGGGQGCAAAVELLADLAGPRLSFSGAGQVTTAHDRARTTAADLNSALVRFDAGVGELANEGRRCLGLAARTETSSVGAVRGLTTLRAAAARVRLATFALADAASRGAAPPVDGDRPDGTHGSLLAELINIGEAPLQAGRDLAAGRACIAEHARLSSALLTMGAVLAAAAENHRTAICRRDAAVDEVARLVAMGRAAMARHDSGLYPAGYGAHEDRWQATISVRAAGEGAAAAVTELRDLVRARDPSLLPPSASGPATSRIDALDRERQALTAALAGTPGSTEGAQPRR